MKNWLFLCLLGLSFSAYSQTGIKVDEANVNRMPNGSAILDAEATTKGILIPQLSLSATNVAAPVITPANSLLIFNTNTAGTGVTAVSPGYYYWDTLSDVWVRLLDPTDSVVTIDSAEWIDGSQVGLTAGNIYARKALARGDTIVIDTNGFVGFGLNNPRHAFHMIQNDGNARLVIERTDNLSGGTLVLEQSGANVTSGLTTGTIDSYSQVSGTRAWTSRIGFYNGAANTREGNIGFYTSDGVGNPTERMTLTKDGYVGIGNSNPSSLLDVGPGCCLGRNIEINGYSYYGSGYSGGATVLGHNVMSDTAMTVTNNMLIANNSTNIGYAAIRVGGSDSDPDVTGYGSISFYGDSGTTIAGTSVVGPNMIIKGESGNVGIGTTTPQEKLGVIGNIEIPSGNYLRMQGAGVNDTLNYPGVFSGIKVHNYGLGWGRSDLAGAPSVHLSGFGGVNFFTGALNRMHITTTGDVGIGTTMPSGRLQIDGRFIFNADGTLDWGQSADYGRLSWDAPNKEMEIYSTSGKNFTLGANGSASNQLVLDTNGNVGVGTTMPLEKFHVEGNIRLGDQDSIIIGGQIIRHEIGVGQNLVIESKEHITLDVDNNSNSSGASIYITKNKTTDTIVRIGEFPNGPRVGIGTVSPLGILHLENDKNAVKDSVFLVMGNGNVGIGTETPSDKLTVSNGRIRMVRTDGSANSMYLGNSSGRDWQIYHLGSADGNAPNGYMLEHFDGAVWRRYFTIKQDGNVGIGTGAVNPTEKLDVDGNIRASGNFISGATTLTVPDYVFEKYYKGTSKLNEAYTFKTLDEIEKFTKTEGHLPGIPSAKEIQEKGQLNLTQSSLNNLEKIEELYLHLIEVNKENKELKEKLQLLEERLNKLESKKD